MRALIVPGGRVVHAISGLAAERTMCAYPTEQGYALYAFWAAVDPQDKCGKCLLTMRRRATS